MKNKFIAMAGLLIVANAMHLMPKNGSDNKKKVTKTEVIAQSNLNSQRIPQKDKALIILGITKSQIPPRCTTFKLKPLTTETAVQPLIVFDPKTNSYKPSRHILPVQPSCPQKNN